MNKFKINLLDVERASRSSCATGLVRQAGIVTDIPCFLNRIIERKRIPLHSQAGLDCF